VSGAAIEETRPPRPYGPEQKQVIVPTILSKSRVEET
jgi:hypothetical protein